MSKKATKKSMKHKAPKSLFVVVVPFLGADYVVGVSNADKLDVRNGDLIAEYDLKGVKRVQITQTLEETA